MGLYDEVLRGVVIGFFIMSIMSLVWRWMYD